MSRPLSATVLLLLSLLGASAAQAALPEPVARMAGTAGIGEDAIAAMVVRLGDGKVMLAHRADAAMQPASTMKMLTTYIGLEQLGPAFRGRTELRSAGMVHDGILEGDLALRGGADSDLSWEALQSMLQTLRNQGIETLRGDLIVDRQLFSPARPELGAPPFDESAEFAYNVIPDALLLNQNLLQIDLESDAEGKLRVRGTPELAGVAIESAMHASNHACAEWENGWLPPVVTQTDDGLLHVTLQGSFPKNCARSTRINVLDKLEYTHRLVRALWRKLGGNWSGASREGATPDGTRLLAEHQARPLADVLRDINKYSDNALARQLFLNIGAHQPLPPAEAPQASAARAEAGMRTWLRAHRIDDTGLVLENGSGLSRSERVSAAQMTALLQVAGTGNWAPEFLSSLPIAALDGTMKRRLKTSPAAQRARIKTGSLKDVVAVAGYVPDAQGRLYAVAAMINSSAGGAAAQRAIADALLDWVARQP